MTKIMVPDEKQKYEKYPKAETFFFKKYIRRINGRLNADDLTQTIEPWNIGKWHIFGYIRLIYD